MRRILVGFACDNACLFCAQGRLRADAEASPRRGEGLDAIVMGDVVAFVGGEPCLAPELPAWIEAAVERGAARVVVQTNGRRLVDVAEALARAGRGRLTLDVSLHGATAAMHDYHTDTAGSFEQTTAGARAARAAGLRFGLTVVVTRSNFRHLAEIATLGVELGAAALHFAGVEPFGAALVHEARLVPAAELVGPHLARAAAVARRAGLGIVAAGVSEPGEARELFAGLGEVEPAPAPALSPETAGRVALPVVGRPAAGRS